MFWLCFVRASYSNRSVTSNGSTLGARLERLIPVAICRAAPIEVKPVNGKSVDAKLDMKYSAIVSAFGAVLAVGESLLPAPVSRFHRCWLPVAYSDS